VNKSSFIIFFSIVLTIYFSVNTYIFIRGLQAFSSIKINKAFFIVLFWLIVLAYPAGRILEKFSITAFSNTLTWIGAIWLATMAYLFFALILLDILRLINHFIPFLPQIVKANYDQAKLTAAAVISGVVFLTVIFGFINAKTPRVTSLELKSNKQNKAGKTLNIVAASDMHLGTIITNSRVERIVDKINSLKPDIVLLAGDVLDEDLAPVIENNLGENLRKIKAKYGVFAITGNHEYIGGVEPAVKYLTEHGVTVLRDTAILIDSSFYLVGREDRSTKGFRGILRKPLNEIIAQLDKTKPVIMMDHQPFGLEDAENNNIDLQISGHTHHGQLWPFNYITNKVYELSWGYKQKGNTHYYVSCGAGTWGPPVKTGNISEVVNIKFNY